MKCILLVLILVDYSSPKLNSNYFRKLDDRDLSDKKRF